MVRDCRGVAVFQNPDYHLLVMERCPGISLFDLIEQRTRLPEAEARQIFTQVLNPMTTCLSGWFQQKSLMKLIIIFKI